ncbi:MAG: type I-MYXAN CRISPR-associated protein Cas6/Cmx6 [Cyanobacteria bacterium NC_groundwater_1444_Ag_S-0.65um_54_12]|nr:type I-MYXAN CRISPR-associated protein Cas6/Cmx6 [Cyanobacteria bacterium NC_groundwater_1444_Ag_S-0.65um_54_12]
MQITTFPSTEDRHMDNLLVIDIAFALRGRDAPLDHGYCLYAALSTILPELHQAMNISIHSLHGPVVLGRLLLTTHACLQIRARTEYLPLLARLMGQRITLDDSEIWISTFQIYPLLPHPTLRSRLVTIKGYQEPETFAEAMRRQANELGIKASFIIGQRRILLIHEKRIVGFEVLAQDLNDEDSLKLQQLGIGGRHKMGCGIFVPVKSRA